MLMSKTSADIRRQKPQNRMKAAPCQGVRAPGTFHHSVISGSEDTEPSLAEGSRTCFKDDRWTRTVPCGVTGFPGEPTWQWPRSLPPPTSWPSIPSSLQEFCLLTLSTPAYCLSACWSGDTGSFLRKRESLPGREP